MSTIPSIGRMTERVTVQQESRTDDASGGFALAWVDVATLFAAVTPLAMGTNASEAQAGEQLTGRSRYRFSLRARPALDINLTTANRLVWRSAALNIRAITQDTGATMTEIIAEDGAPT